MKNYYIFQNNKKSAIVLYLGDPASRLAWRRRIPHPSRRRSRPGGLRPHVGGRRGTEAKDAPELTGTRHCPGGPGVPWTAP